MNVNLLWKIVNMITKSLKMIFLSMFFISSVYAGVDVVDNEQGSFSQSDPDAIYGNGQNATFRRAMGADVPLDERDQTFLDSISVQNPDNRSYLRARLGRPKLQLKKITNVSEGSSAAPTVLETNEKLWRWTLAYGYKWQNWIIEAELLTSEGAHYNASPMRQGDTFYLNARIKNYTPMLNVEYEFGNEFAFMPKRLHLYLSGGIGAALIKTEASTYGIATGIPVGSQSFRDVQFSWNLGAGLRYDIIGNLLFDLSYRYMDLGKTQIGPVSGATLKIGDILSSGVFAGLVYRI